MSTVKISSKDTPTSEFIPVDASGNVLDPTNVLPTGATAISVERQRRCGFGGCHACRRRVEVHLFTGFCISGGGATPQPP
jgi:hypothetical protein